MKTRDSLKCHSGSITNPLCLSKCRTLQHLTIVIICKAKPEHRKGPKCVCNTLKALTWDNPKQGQVGTKSCTSHAFHRNYSKLSQRLKTKIKQKNTLKNKTECQGKWFWQYIDVFGKYSHIKNYEVKFITLFKNKTRSSINVFDSSFFNVYRPKIQ